MNFWMKPPIYTHHDIPTIERIDSPEGRLYKTPSGDLYPSVTGIVSHIGDKTYLDEWRKKVGDEFANKIIKEATDRGTLLHQKCEDYLRGNKVSFDMFQLVEKEMFGYFKPVLDSVTEIHAIEQPLWSDKLKCAGTVDLIALHNGKLKIIDWKNSRRYKTKEEIPGYFAQMSAYAYMFWERTGIPIGRLLVAIAVMDYGLVEYEVSIKDYLPLFKEARKKYDEQRL